MHILNNGQVNIGSITNVVSVINSKAATTYVDTQINTEITNLIGGAPGALDTLNELAAALGDDASYATTVTNNLALKALKNAEAISHKDEIVLYNLASLYSLQDKTDLSLVYLDKALKYGFNNFDAIRYDPDLTNVRSEPGFRTTLEKHKVFIQ